VQLTAAGGSVSASALAGVNVVPYTVAVTPDAKGVGVLASASKTQPFTVQNLTSASVTYTFAVLCTGTGVSNCSQPASQGVPAGSAATVNVSYNSSATLGATGRVRLQASGAPGQDSGWVNVTVGSMMAPSLVDVTKTTPGSLLEPQICVTVAATRGSAYQCGDLRIVHPLPTTRTMNRVRTPTLLYTSQHAHPYPLIAANVSLNAAAATPDSVVATLKINPNLVTHARSRWNGADWIPGRASRIVIADTFVARVPPTKDTVYSYTLEVVNYYGSSPTAATPATGTFAVVGRSASPFGTGWWLAGLERLDVATMIWSSGDGALRQYTSAGTNIWSAPTLDRPDTLKRIGNYYLRILAHGDTVKFDLTGRHVATANRLGQLTILAYDGCNRLQSITLPPTGSGRVYTFTYASPTDCTTKLQTVTAPPIGATARVTTLTVVNRRVTMIRDPDNTTVSFTYGTGVDTNRIASRTDRRGTATTFTYDGGKKLSLASIANGTGQQAIKSRFRAVQSYGIANAGTLSAIDTALAYTRLDGARVDAGDTTIFWETKFFIPYRIVNALGYQTKLFYHDSMPALVTKLVYPNGRALGAVYDARGNVLSVTDSSVFQNNKYATTLYAWDPKWNFVTRIIRPELDSVKMGYDTTTGNRTWQQDGRGATSQTDFYYYSNTAPDSVRGLLRSIRTPSQSLPSSRDSVTYNALGNLTATKTPRGFWTRYRKDNVGRDTLVVSPTLDPTVDPDTLKWQRQSITYDVSDRVTQTRSNGPALSFFDPITATTYWTTPESLFVATFYNAEGLPDSLRRWARPNPNGINTLATKWAYDPAGRRVKETAPDGMVDSTVYDAAGNAVKLLTRRGHTITLTYDLLNLLTKRVTPAVTYQPWLVNAYSEPWKFPYFRADASGGLTVINDGNYGLTIAGETETFTYDSVGNLLTADNSAARIRRGYNLNGTLAGDTLKILPYVGTDTTLHVYGLRFTYDLDGRRKSLRHPFPIAPRVQGAVKDTVGYRYLSTTGLLQSVTDVLGDWFEYTYNLENQVSQLDKGASIMGGSPEVRVTYAYDADGRDNLRMETRGIAPGEVMHADTLFHDARGKITRARTYGDTTVNAYTGLGAFAWSYSWRGDQPQLYPTERHIPDALGNLYESRHNQNQSSTYDVTSYVYQATTGRLLKGSHANPNPYSIDSTVWDSAGNAFRALGLWNNVSVGGLFGDLLKRTASYYDAAGRLRVQDRRSCLSGDFSTCSTIYFPEYNERTAFEEYRYDALGRRILVRTRSEWTCGLRCRNAITRVVWDGDQILYEISSPGATSATVAQLEQDTGQVVVQKATNYLPYGRVVYTHGAGLDAPLGLLRMNYSDVFPEPILVLPLANWAGSYDIGTIWGSTTYSRRYPNPITDSLYYMVIDWPAPYLWKTLDSRSRGYQGPVSWMGSLIEAGRDGSGQMYRRNRYYDPASGRFTQEDPIGLAGGMNLYGFAAADPVNFSDPFGLRVCFKGTRFEIKQLSTAIRNASDTDFDLDKQNCVTNVRSRGHKQLDKIRAGFQDLVNSDATFEVRFTRIFNSTQIDPYAVEAFEKYSALAYSTTINGRCVPESERWDLNQVMAHELYHHFPVAQGQAMDYDENKATQQENVFNRYAGRPIRCSYY
jgi:RHS repeat-associated protein